MTSRNKTASVLGATGGFGDAVAAALARRDWMVKAVARDPAKAARGTATVLNPQAA